MNIDGILSYKNKKVIERFQRDYNFSRKKSEKIFQELMKYIWLCCKHNEEKKQFPSLLSLQFECYIYEEMSEIDDMWHTFLLFTQSYYDFCHHYLNGDFFHHQPFHGKKKMFSKQEKNKLNLYLSYIYDKLGENTLREWFKFNE